MYDDTCMYKTSDIGCCLLVTECVGFSEVVDTVKTADKAHMWLSGVPNKELKITAVSKRYNEVCALEQPAYIHVPMP